MHILCTTAAIGWGNRGDRTVVEGEKTKESKESAKGAEDTAVKETDKSTESTNSICELKDSPLLTANNELKPYSTDELKDLLGKAKTVELSQQGKSLDTPKEIRSLETSCRKISQNN